MNRTVICSFYVNRPKDYPSKLYPVIPRYLDLLAVLDRSCARAGLEHVVLTDVVTSDMVGAAGFKPFMSDLPRNLMQSVTEIQARWLESPHSKGVDTVFVGADCIVLRDFRGLLPACDLGIAFMKGHKKWRLNTGFMFIPASSRERVAPLFRLIADDTGEAMCEDMIALERALVPMPADYGTFDRAGLKVAFLPLAQWNHPPKYDGPPTDACNVLHFMGGWEDQKALFFEYARKLDLA